MYVAEPTAVRFHADSESFVRGLMGPIGSGKSVACCAEIYTRALRQALCNGVRRSRWAIIRNTYPELRTTTIKTWQEWVPPHVCSMTYGAPITGTIRDRRADDNTPVEAEVFFLALDKPKDIKKLLSLELTGAWINEAREVPKAVLDAVTSRVGRYPAARDGGPSWSGVIMDTNPPDVDHWYYRLAEQERPEGWQFYRQPGALLRTDTGTLEPNPAAENIDNQPLRYEYWRRLSAGKDPEWVKVYVLGEYGFVFDGRSVYDQVYSDSLHVSPTPIGVWRNHPLLLGWDFGLTPACIVGQLTPSGRLNILREYVCERAGIRQFATDVVKPALANEFKGLQIISDGDPAGDQASQVDEQTPINELGRLGIPTDAAVTNNFTSRRDSVLYFLTRLVDGKPAFQLDPSCQVLRKGFAGGYHFSRIQVAGDERFKDEPNKNKYSHPHDALQYLCLRAAGVTRESLRGPRSVLAQRGGWGGAV